MAYKRTTQRQAFIQPVQSAPSTGDIAMSNMFGDISTLFSNLSQQQQTKDKKKFAVDEMWRAYKEAPTAVTNKDGVLTPNWTGSLIDYAKGFSEDAQASKDFYRLLLNTVTTQITTDITAKAKELYTSNPTDLNNISALRGHVNGVKSVWKDSPSILSAIEQEYGTQKKTLEVNVNNSVTNKAFDQNAVSGFKAIEIASEQLNALAYHNKTPANNVDAKKIIENINNQIDVLKINPNVDIKELAKIEKAMMGSFSNSYYKGLADRKYIEAETDENIATNGLDALNQFKLELENYDGSKPLPFGFTKDMAVSSVKKVIADRVQQKNLKYTTEKRDDALVVGKFSDLIQRASTDTEFGNLQSQILSTTFNFPGTQGSLLNEIRVKRNQIISDRDIADKGIKDNYNTDISLIALGKQPKHKTYDEISTEYINDDLPVGVAKAFVNADDKRNKILSSQNILQTETLLESKFDKISEHNTPEKLEQIIKNMPNDLPSTTDKSLIIKSQNRLMDKLDAYTINYEKMIQHKLWKQNLVGTINGGGVISSANTNKLWKEWTNDEGVNFDDPEGHNKFLSFVGTYKHFPTDAALKFNAVLLSGNMEEIQKIEKLIMASYQFLTYGSNGLSKRSAKERIFSQLKSGDSNADSAGRATAFLELRFAEVPIETALSIVENDKISSGNSKIKGMASVGLLDSANKEDVIRNIHGTLNKIMSENDNFIIDWIQEISGFGSTERVKAVNEYFEKFGDTDVLMQAIMQPGVKNLYYNTFLSTFSEPHYKDNEAGIREAALATAVKLRGAIGFATTPLPNKSFNMLDPRNYLPFRDTFVGNNNNVLVRFVKNPITYEFNKTRPPEMHKMPDMDFYKADISDIFNKAYLNKEFIEGDIRKDDALYAIQNGYLIFHARERFGNKRSYEVYGINKEGVGFSLMDHYVPNWHTMEAKKAWNEIQDEGIKTVLGQIDANLAIIGLPIAQQALTNYMENKTDRNLIVRFMDFVSKSSKTLGLPDIAYGGLEESQKVKLRSELQNYFNLIKPPNIGFPLMGIK